MIDTKDRARRVVDAVLQAAPPPEIARPDYLEEQLEPLRELLAAVADGLKIRRAKASVRVADHHPSRVPGMITDHGYALLSNSGKSAFVTIKGILDMPGAVPRFVIMGMDEAAQTALEGLAGERNWIDVYPHVTRAGAELEAFLLRFLPS